MGGSLRKGEKIRKSLLLIKDDTSDIARRTSALIFTFAEKFLTGEELADVKEVFRMTRLGQMLVDDGVHRVITAMLRKGKSVSSIAADTDISEEEIRAIQRSMKKENNSNRIQLMRCPDGRHKN